MKKFFFRLCTSAVKSMHTAVCIVLFSVSVLAQNSFLVNKPDSMPFHKWEVSLDVKPLFRSDAPYNIISKWHFSEKQALRLGLGTANLSIQRDTLDIYENFFDNKTQQNILQYQQAQYGPNDTKYINWDIKIGYQYEFKRERVGFYAAVDFDWKIEKKTFNVPVQIDAVGNGNIEPFNGYQSIFFLYDRKSNYTLINSIGMKYALNNSFTCSIETSLNVQLLDYYYATAEFPLRTSPDGVYIKNTMRGGKETSFSFIPVMGLFVNYHF